MVSPHDQSTSQTFVCFGWDHLPTNTFFPQATLTDHFGPEPPLHHFDFCGACACLLIWEGGVGKSFSLSSYLPRALSIDISSFRCAQCKNLPPAIILANGGDSPELQTVSTSNSIFYTVLNALPSHFLSLVSSCFTTKLRMKELVNR